MLVLSNRFFCRSTPAILAACFVLGVVSPESTCAGDVDDSSRPAPKSSEAEPAKKESATEAPVLALGEIEWQKDYDAALALAKKTERPILVDFFTTWCGPCKKLDRETFADERVIRFVGQFFVALKIDADEHPELRKKHAVEGYPTLLFLSPAGKEIHRILGFRDAPTFLSEAQKAARASSTLKKLKEEASSRPDDLDAQRAYALALFAAGNTDEAAKILRACLEKSPESISARLDFADLLRSIHRGDEAAKEYEKVLVSAASADEAPASSSEYRRAAMALAEIKIRGRDPERAITVLGGYLDRGAEGKGRLEALFLRALALAKARRAGESLADLKAVAEADPEGYWGYRASLIRDLVERTQNAP